MTKEQILELIDDLDLKVCFRSWCDTMERLRKSTDVAEITDYATCMKWVNALKARTDKARIAKEKKIEKHNAELKRMSDIKALVVKADSVGVDAIEVLNAAIKQKYNDSIQQQIDALKAQLM